MIKLKYSIKDMGARAVVKGLEDRLTKPERFLREVGLVLLRSIARTFRYGGRPVRWKPSRRATRKGGKTLIKTARLMRSITMRVRRNILEVGTNVKYAAALHEGINKNVRIREHWRIMRKAFGKVIPGRHVLVSAHQRRMKIPARPFLVIQSKDWRVFHRIGRDYLTEG